MKYIQASVIVLLLAFVAFGAWRFFSPNVMKDRNAGKTLVSHVERPVVEEVKPAPAVAVKTEKKVGVAKRVKEAKIVKPRPRGDEVDDFPEESEIPAADRPYVKRVRKALEAENVEEIIACAEMLAKSRNPEVRSGMVSALQWCGRSAMSELVNFMADRDDDVRTEALDAWSDAIDEIDSPTLKRDLLLASMLAITDSDSLESLAVEVSDLPNSYQIDIYSALIESENRAAIEVAREEYESLTDENYTSRESAERWLVENPDDPIELQDVVERDAAAGVETPEAVSTAAASEAE